MLHQRLTVGGPSITDPIEKSKGFHFALVSYHKDRQALEEYQASPEHHKYVSGRDLESLLTAYFELDLMDYRVTSEYLWPYKEDVTRFDYEISEAEQMFL